VSGPLEYARELEALDVRLARELASVEELQRRAGAIGARAAELDVFARSLPVERVRVAEALAAAAVELAAREAERERAEARAEEDPEARRAAARAEVAASVVRKRIERLQQEQERLEAGAAALPDEIRELAREAAGATAALAHATVTAPPPDAEYLIAWASRARAALLLARSSLEGRREHVVREASELAASVLGEPVAASVAGIRERLERAARSEAT
jgi:hypothetical protein